MTFECRLNPSDAEVDQIQKEIDADGNGEIDFEEFLSKSTAQPKYKSANLR